MAIRSRDFVGIAEGIRSHELSTKQVIEALSSRSAELVSLERTLESRISYLEAAIAAAYEDTDEDGEPDYARIAVLEAQLNEVESELDEAEAERVKTDNELRAKQTELETVQGEKARTLFEIQERARKTSQNIGIAGGMIGAYATVGNRLQSSLQSSLSSLSQAAGILGGSVDSGTGGASNVSSSGIGGGSKAGAGKGTAAGALSAFVGGGDGNTLPLPSQFSTSQDQLSTAAAVLGARSEQQTIAVQPLQDFSTEQGANIYAAGAFSDLGTDPIPAVSGASFQSNEVTQGLQDSFQVDGSPSGETLAAAAVVGAMIGTQRQRQHTFEDWIDPANYKDGHYVGEGQPWGYKPFGEDTATVEAAVMTPAQRKLHSYMQSHNYGKGDFESFTKDPEWQSLYSAAYPASDLLVSLRGSSLAKKNLRDYMNIHGYGPVDFPTYSKDPQWQWLHQMAFPDSGVVSSLVGSALAAQQLHEYMISNHYTQADYPIYSKDPVWQRLHKATHPDYQQAKSSKRVISTAETEKFSMRIRDRAHSFFEQYFEASTSHDSSPSREPSKTLNQILAGAQVSAYSLEREFDALKSLEIHKLTRENLQDITEIAVANLKVQYKDMIPLKRFDEIRAKVSFVGDETVRKELGKDYSPNICGYYSPSSDTIKVNLDGNATVGDLLATIDHEAMHLISKNRTGARGGVLDPGIVFGNVGMNEGLTEMYSIKNMQAVHPDYVSKSYTAEVDIMTRFESICGADRLLSAYLHNNLTEIASDFNSCLGSHKAFEKFCNDIDILHHYSHIQSRSADAAVQRANARLRISEKLEAYRKAKEQPRINIAPQTIEHDTRGTVDKDNVPKLQYRIGRTRPEHEAQPQREISVVQSESREKRFRERYAERSVTLAMQQEAVARALRKPQASSDGAPDRDERQRERGRGE